MLVLVLLGLSMGYSGLTCHLERSISTADCAVFIPGRAIINPRIRFASRVDDLGKGERERERGINYLFRHCAHKLKSFGSNSHCHNPPSACRM